MLQARTFLEPHELFKGEVDETIGKVQTALRITKAFKTCYEEHREKIPTYFKDGEAKIWEFAPKLVFYRYDDFLERIELVVVSAGN